MVVVVFFFLGGGGAGRGEGIGRGNLGGGVSGFFRLETLRQIFVKFINCNPC